MAKTPPFFSDRPTNRRTVLTGLGATAVVGLPAARALAQPQPPRDGTMAGFRLTPEPTDVPPISILASDGTEVPIHDFRGKFTLINFWATWCVPCRVEMPSLDRLQAKLGGEDFRVTLISMDQGGLNDLPKVERFFRSVEIAHLTTFFDRNSAAAQTFAIRGLPSTVLLDREARLVGGLLGEAAWDAPETIALMRWFIDRPGQA